MDPTPPALNRTASLWTAWDLLHRSRANHLVVVDDRGRPVGVLDDRTIAQEWPAGPMDAHRTPLHALVRDRDQARPRVHAHDDMRVAARVLLGARTDAVPVVDAAGRLIGLLTLRHFAELASAGDREPVVTGAASGSSERTTPRSGTDRPIATADGPGRAFSDLKEDLAAPRLSALRSTLGLAVASAALQPFGERAQGRPSVDVVDEWGIQSFPASDPPPTW
jgi:CBS domain-containing protein